MQINLKEMNYTVNSSNGVNTDVITFKKNNIITGGNNFGKSFLMSLVLVGLGSRFEKEEMIDLALEKNFFKINVELDYEIVGDGYKSDGDAHQIKSIIDYENGSEPSYKLFIDDREKIIKGTSDYAKYIFRILGIPRKIVWTSSLTTLFMDDLLRFGTLSQSNINNVYAYKNILPVLKAQRIRIAIIMLWMKDRNNKLIKDLIDNEDLFRTTRLVDIVGSLKTTIRTKSLSADGEEFRRGKKISPQILNAREELTASKKVLIENDKKMQFLRMAQDKGRDINRLGILGYFESLRETHQIPDAVERWMDANIQALSINYYSELKDEYKTLESNHEIYLEDVKHKNSKLDSLVKSINDEDLPFVLNEFISHLPDETTKPNGEIEEMKKLFGREYKGIIDWFNDEISEGSGSIRWSREGGATQLKQNVNRTVSINKSMKNLNVNIPLILDGVLAEDFDSSDAEWVKNVIESENQFIIAYSSKFDEKTKELHKAVEKMVSVIDKKELCIKTLSHKIF